MASSYDITYRHSAGNLHIRLEGEFNGMCAWELIKTISGRYQGGRVFVRTDDLNAVVPSAVALFRQHMASHTLPLENLYLKGEKGFAMAPDGARVMIVKKQPEKKKPFLRLCRNRCASERAKTERRI